VEKVTLLEKLNDEIEEKKNKIEELECIISKKENIEKNKWQHHVILKETNLTKTLPVPRIQMDYVTDGYNRRWIYGFVFKPFWFQWEDDENILFIPISLTTGAGGTSKNKIDLRDMLPFRDGKHIKFDSKNFNLRAFFVCEDENFCVEIFDKEEA